MRMPDKLYSFCWACGIQNQISWKDMCTIEEITWRPGSPGPQLALAFLFRQENCLKEGYGGQAILLDNKNVWHIISSTNN